MLYSALAQKIFLAEILGGWEPHVSNKEDFPQNQIVRQKAFLAFQRRLALMVYCKFAEKLNIYCKFAEKPSFWGRRGSPHTSPIASPLSVACFSNIFNQTPLYNTAACKEEVNEISTTAINIKLSILLLFLFAKRL